MSESNLDSEGIARALADIDATMNKANGGTLPPGGGLHLLLRELMVSSYGIARHPFPVEPKPDEGEAAKIEPSAG